jgi:tRNA(fMet)-specific endonuclease VapC
MRYLLDTNIVSDLVRNPQGKVAQHIHKIGEAQVCTSIIVHAELRYGATKKGSQRLSAQLEAVLGRLKFCPSRRRQMPLMDSCVRGLSRLADQSAPMTC